MAIFIRKVKDPYGWLGNMSPYPIIIENKEYRTSEALFQSMRFKDINIINLIIEQKSPMAAKMISKKYKKEMIIQPLSSQDLENMRFVLNAKIQQHKSLLTNLLETNDQEIIEDCSNRPRGSNLFWGSAYKDGNWIGENWLGKLWMEIRTSMKS